MKGHHDIIYLATDDQDFGNTANNDFNILLTEPPIGKIYKKYISERVVSEMLEKLRVVCGNRAIRFVDKQIKIIKGEYV